jgi:hypothetical protein
MGDRYVGIAGVTARGRGWNRPPGAYVPVRIGNSGR